MKKAADILYLLSTFSIRSSFTSKAATYARVGYQLFPDDIRLIEIHAYALMLQGEFQEAEDVLKKAITNTPNVLYLKSRSSILLQLPKEERRDRIRSYLGNFQQ